MPLQLYVYIYTYYMYIYLLYSEYCVYIYIYNLYIYNYIFTRYIQCGIQYAIPAELWIGACNFFNVFTSVNHD